MRTFTFFHSVHVCVYIVLFWLCSCVCVCVCIYLSICVYVWLCIVVCVSMCVRVYLNVCVCIFVCVAICMCVWLGTYIQLYRFLQGAVTLNGVQTGTGSLLDTWEVGGSHKKKLEEEGLTFPALTEHPTKRVSIIHLPPHHSTHPYIPLILILEGLKVCEFCEFRSVHEIFLTNLIVDHSKSVSCLWKTQLHVFMNNLTCEIHV